MTGHSFSRRGTQRPSENLVITSNPCMYTQLAVCRQHVLPVASNVEHSDSSLGRWVAADQHIEATHVLFGDGNKIPEAIYSNNKAGIKFREMTRVWSVEYK